MPVLQHHMSSLPPTNHYLKCEKQSYCLFLAVPWFHRTSKHLLLLELHFNYCEALVSPNHLIIKQLIIKNRYFAMSLDSYDLGMCTHIYTLRDDSTVFLCVYHKTLIQQQSGYMHLQEEAHHLFSNVLPASGPSSPLDRGEGRR